MTSKADQTVINQTRKAMRDGLMPPPGVRINFGDPEPITVTSPEKDPGKEKEGKKP